MKLIYAFACGFNKKGNFKVYLKHHAKDVVKLVYTGDERIKRSSIVQVSAKKKFVVIGTKTINDPQMAKKYPVIDSQLSSEGLWGDYWIKPYKKFMNKFKISFKPMPLIKIGGYHYLNQDNKFYFKITNKTKNIKYLRPGAIAYVYTKYGRKKLHVTDVDFIPADKVTKDFNCLKQVDRITSNRFDLSKVH